MTFHKNIARYISFSFVFFIINSTAFSHVKWFSNFNFIDKPRTIEEVTTPVFWFLFILSLIVISLSIILDNRINELGVAKKINHWLDDRKKYSLDVIRIAMFTVLSVSWVNDTVLTPELIASNSLVSWFQFFLQPLLYHQK